MQRISKMLLPFSCLILFFGFSEAAPPSQKSMASISEETQGCLNCHKMYTPGIVEDWLNSRHSRTTPQEALKQDAIARRISSENVPEKLASHAIGCYECHSLNPENHKDNFEHMGYKINVIVTPNDCKTCHSIEVEQYLGSKKGNAHKNLMKNPVYHTLVKSVTGLKTIEDGKIKLHDPTQNTLNDVCLGCHGTILEVQGMKQVVTKMGEITVPNILNWPNQGVGRENPDGSLGSCTSCHTRHGFSIKEARKPYTCSQCHAEPDVPAWYVYKVSKHGNIFSARSHEWDFDAVPWAVGRDFLAPTCATCHNSLIVSPSSGEVIAERTHDFGSRLYMRIFGLIYSHPQPKSGNTSVIKNTDGLPMPTTFTGQMAQDYLIDQQEQQNRLGKLKSVCTSCHSSDWTNQHFVKFENHVVETDKMTLAATQLVQKAWDLKIADSANPFDEAIEQMWIRQWLFYSNTVRYASAMTGAYDYTGFNFGWWDLSENLQHMNDMIEIQNQKK
jgi:hypothetical protein